MSVTSLTILKRESIYFAKIGLFDNKTEINELLNKMSYLKEISEILRLHSTELNASKYYRILQQRNNKFKFNHSHSFLE